jgi:hypothetical protein
MTRHEQQCFCLGRLGHLLELYEHVEAWTGAGRRLLEQALYATYRDCELVGLRPVARAILTGCATRESQEDSYGIPIPEEREDWSWGAFELQ